MADIASGIESGDGDALDVNTDAGFNALLAHNAAEDGEITEDVQKVLDTLKDDDRSVSTGLTQESTRTRDASGRFAPAAQEEEEGAAPAEESEGQEEAQPQENQALAEFLQRHEGDAQKALESALQEKDAAQSQIGRQSNELGELRERLAKMEGRLEATPQQAQPQRTPQPISREQLEGWIAGEGQDGAGGMDAWQWAAQEYDGNPQMMNQILDIWKDYDPYNAAIVRNDWMNNLRELERQQKEPKAEPDPDLEELRQAQRLGGIFKQVQAGLDPSDWAVIKDHVIDTFTDETTPVIVKNAVVSEDRATQTQGVQALVQLAKGRALAVARAQTEQKVVNTEAKKKASVATGSLRPVAERQPQGGEKEELSPEEVSKRFTKALLETETTSVADGLRYGSAVMSRGS